MSEAMPATGIAGILAAPGSCARPSRAVPPGSVAELSCQKIIFDLQLADLPVQMIDLGLIAGSLCRTTTLEDACRTVQQLLLPVVDLVRVDPELPSQLGDGPVAPDGRQRHLRLERRAVLLPCPVHVLLPRYPRFLGAGLHLSHLSHFPGPAQSSRGPDALVLGDLYGVKEGLNRGFPMAPAALMGSCLVVLKRRDRPAADRSSHRSAC